MIDSRQLPQTCRLRVFVMGCSRGGTTLTQRLVAERLGLRTLPETRFFANMVGNVEARRFPLTQRPLSLRRRTSSALRIALGLSTGMQLLEVPGVEPIKGQKWAPFTRMTAVFLERMDQLAIESNAMGWLEKTPDHVFYAPLIAKLVPEAWMIHVIRDAEETVGSIRDAAKRLHAHWETNYDRVERDVDKWNASVAASAAMVGKPRQIFVPYAAMTRAPNRVMDHIAGMVGIGSESQTTVMTAKPPIRAVDLAVGRELLWKQGAISGSVQPAESKWETALTADERARARALIRPLPQKLIAAMAPFVTLAAAGSVEDQ